MTKFEKWIINEISVETGGVINSVKDISMHEDQIGNKALKVLMEYACKSQTTALIIQSRVYMSEISKEWLKLHFMNVSDECIDYSDGWEYRRLVELVEEVIPELRKEVFFRGKDVDDNEIKEVIEDFYKDFQDSL